MRDYHGDGGAAAQRESEEGFEVKRREGPHSNSLAELKRLVLECPGAICLQKSLRGSEREKLVRESLRAGVNYFDSESSRSNGLV